MSLKYFKNVVNNILYELFILNLPFRIGALADILGNFSFIISKRSRLKSGNFTKFCFEISNSLK